MPKKLIDTNILVRFFAGEPPEMAERARRLVQNADDGKTILVVLPIILAETFYTLESFYEIKRKIVAEKLAFFIQTRGVEAVERPRLLDALNRCQTKNVHFADAYLAACAAELDVEIASFDRDFDKFGDIRRVEP